MVTLRSGSRTFSPSRGDAARRYRFVLAAAAALLVVPAGASTGEPAAGLYAIEAYTMMPHLDEMRRIRKFEERCVGGGDVSGLFPVMRQIAFRGCVLLPRDTDPGEYTLRCRTDFVATGLAVLEHGENGFSGTLAVKMGGKNMTFSQHMTARRLGPCAGDPPG